MRCADRILPGVRIGLELFLDHLDLARLVRQDVLIALLVLEVEVRTARIGDGWRQLAVVPGGFARGRLHVQLRVGPWLDLPVRATGVVVPAREAPAVPESLAHLVLELVPGTGHAEAEAVALRLLVVPDPVVAVLPSDFRS